jgi:hypothetical protein
VLVAERIKDASLVDAVMQDRIKELERLVEQETLSWKTIARRSY